MFSYQYLNDKDIFSIKKYEKIFYYNDYTNTISRDVKIPYRPARSDVDNNQTNYPRRIVILPSNVCNLSCTYCFSQKDRLNNELLDFEKVEKTFKSIMEEDVHRELHIVFTGGGEPTANPIFIKKCVELFRKRNNVSFSITTNGCFSNEVRQILHDNKFSVAFSIDGDYNIEARQQMIPLSEKQYNQALYNAVALKADGQKVSIITVLTANTLLEYSGKEKSLINHTLDHFYNHGLLVVGIAFDRDVFCIEPDTILLDTMARYCMEIVNWKHTHKDMLVNCNYIFSRANYSYLEKGICEGITRFPNDIRILPNGRITFCNRIQDEKFSYTAYSKTDLQKQLKGQIKDTAHKMMEIKKKCISCIARQSCMAGICPATIITRTDEQLRNYCSNNHRLRMMLLDKYI